MRVILTKIMIPKNSTVSATFIEYRNHLFTFGKGAHCKKQNKYLEMKVQQIWNAQHLLTILNSQAYCCMLNEQELPTTRTDNTKCRCSVPFNEMLFWLYKYWNIENG